MSKGKENCRLCLKILEDDYNTIEEITREMFNVLLIKIDLSVSEEPLICKSCMESVQQAFDFKSTCFAVDEQVVSLVIDRSCAEMDIRDVYLKENENKNVFIEEYNICRFCLQYLKESNFNFLNDLRQSSSDEMLLECIPELDLNIVKEAVVCTTCMKSLETYYVFAMKCRLIEEYIMKYREVQGVECPGQISLVNVLKLITKEAYNCSETPGLTGHNMYQNNGNTYSDITNSIFKIENEELIIKAESEYGDCKTEENICYEARQNEVVNHDMLTREDPLAVVMFRCASCTYNTKNKISLERHMLVHSDKSKMRDNIINHLLTHKDPSDVGKYRCEKCTFETKYKSSLKVHMLAHRDISEVIMYNCNLRSHKSKTKQKLKTHLLIHMDPSEKYRCERCTFETIYRGNLDQHKLVHMDKSEVFTYNCNLCTYKSKRKGTLKAHLLSHKSISDVVTYSCAICPFKTKYKKDVKTHMLVHKDTSEVTMYSCHLCSYKSKIKYNIGSHLLIHKDPSDIVMYKCETCTFETKYKTSFKRHMSIHEDKSEITSDIVMYKCERCSYVTKYRSNLKQHMFIHKDKSEVTSDIVMYKCEMCTYATKYKSNLKKHIMSIHTDKSEVTSDIVMYKCERCTFVTKYRSYLKKHHKSIHKVKSKVTTDDRNLCSYKPKSEVTSENNCNS